MTQTNTSMNFLPEDYVEKRQATRTAIVFIGLLLVVVGGIVGSYLYSQWSMSGVFKARDESKAAVDSQMERKKTVDDLEAKKGEMIGKANVITALMERLDRSSLLKEMTRLSVSSNVKFVSMELKTKEVDVNKPNAALEQARRAQDGLPAEVKLPAVDVTVTLVGTAPTDSDVANYLASLQKSPMLANVTLLFSEEFKKNKDDAPVRRFNFEMHINPDYDQHRAGSTVVSASPKE